MSISAVGSAPVMPISTPLTTTSANGAEGHDADGDEGGGSAPVQAQPAPGTGQIVDRKA